MTETDSNPKILIVDDHGFMRHVLKTELGREGFTVFEAEDGNKALILLKDTKIDLILMDAIMPGMDGFETSKKVREGNKTVPIIFLTANASKETVVAAIQSGGNDFIVKGADSHVIAEKIRKHLSKAK